MADDMPPLRRKRLPRQRILLNFPSELAEQLRDLAERERRPLSTQIQVLIERALQTEALAA